MAEFTAGDRVVKMSGIAAGKYGTVNSVREDGTLNVTFDGERMARFCDPERCGKVAANAKFKVGDRVKNARACNRASVYEYGVGDTVKLRSGRTGEVLSKYVDKDGNLSIEINLNGTRYAVSADMVDCVVKTARACNAEITPELRRAYDEWQKAKAKFNKWWNPDRRLSERPPKDADETKKSLEFAAVFKKVTGKLTPSGYGSMTLEQMVDAVS